MPLGSASQGAPLLKHHNGPYKTSFIRYPWQQHQQHQHLAAAAITRLESVNRTGRPRDCYTQKDKHTLPCDEACSALYLLVVGASLCLQPAGQVLFGFIAEATTVTATATAKAA